jgi:hypothetical protein
MPDAPQFALNATAGKSQPLPNLVVEIPLKFALGDLAKAIVIEPVHQPLEFFRGDRQYLRCWSIAMELIESCAGVIWVGSPQQGLAADSPAATFLLVEVALLSDDFPACDRRQEAPKLLAIDKRRELAASDALEQTPQNTECDIFLVADPAGCGTETGASQFDELSIIPLPQMTCGILVASFKPPQPACHRLIARHNRPPTETQTASALHKILAIISCACRPNGGFSYLRVGRKDAEAQLALDLLSTPW